MGTTNGGTTFTVLGAGGGGGAGYTSPPASNIPLSYIEDAEQPAAKLVIDEHFIKLTGKPFGMRVSGYYIACKIFIRPEEIKTITDKDGKEVTLWLPPNARDNDKYHSCAALVCGIGPQAFTGFDIHGNKRFPAGAACRVGDWIAIPRQQCFMLSYRTVACALLPDDMVLAVIEDPKDVTPITQAALI